MESKAASMTSVVLSLGFSCLVSAVVFAQSAQQVRDTLLERQAFGDKNLADGWIFEDIDAGYAAARKSDKPLLVAFR